MSIITAERVPYIRPKGMLNSSVQTTRMVISVSSGGAPGSRGIT